jgi:glutamyl-tRNA reductase
VRTETGIAKGAVSISSAAAEFSHWKLMSDCQIASGRMQDAKIVIVGAGKMARLLLVHLQSQGVSQITVVNRGGARSTRVQELQAEFPDMAFTVHAMESLYEALLDADVVYPSTASESTIIDPEPLQLLVQQRQVRQQTLASQLSGAVGSLTGMGGLQIVDISVPRNVHPGCNDVDDVFSYNVDDLKMVVERNTAKRRREMLEAEHILRDELSKFGQWQQSLGAIPTITKLQEKAEQLRAEEVKKAMNKLSQLSAKDLETVEKITKGIVAKLLHGPMHHLRSCANNNNNAHVQGKESRVPVIAEGHTAAIVQFQKAFQLDA